MNESSKVVTEMGRVGITPNHQPHGKSIGIVWLAILLAYYLGISWICIRYYQHEIGADGISYISLAQKYLDGDFSNAVNGYWAPMISWILTPFLYLGLEPILAFRTASIVIGIVTLAGIDKLMTTLQLTKYTRILYLVSLSPVIAWYAENDVGADLLGASILVYYTHSTLRDKYQNSGYSGLISGLLGALAYLAKNYNFYFFLLHFSCVNLWYWAQASGNGQKRKIMVNFISALAVFALLSGSWIWLISGKYHTFTVGTAGGYNVSLIGPGAEHPMLTEGFIVPPNSTAVSCWEDPSYLKYTHWSPFQSGDDFVFYMKHIVQNISKYVRGLAVNYIFDLTIAYFIFLFFVQRKKYDKNLLLILLTLFLYPLGYFALYYDGQRHVLINFILMYVLSAYAVNQLIQSYIYLRRFKAIISSVLCISLVVLTLARVNRDLKLGLTDNNEVFRLSSEIEKFYTMKNSKVASQGGNWNHTTDLAYFLKAKYFGRAKLDISNEQLRRELINHQISYYLVYGQLKNNIDILVPERRFASVIGDIAVYRVVPSKI